jgi:hypothetical protein
LCLPLLAGGHEGAEEGHHARVEVVQPLRVPLHGQGEGMVFDFDRLDEPIGRIGHGPQARRQITDALMHLAQSGMVLACKFEGKRFDCGSVEGFVEATNYLYNVSYNQEN